MLFPYLSDVEPEVLAKIDQKRGEPGDPGVGHDELNQVFNAEHRYLFERYQSMDRDFGVVVDDTWTVSADDTETALPTGVRVLRQLYELKDGKPCRTIDVGSWHEMQGSCQREALYQPYPTPKVVWINIPRRDMTVRVIYTAMPPHLFHGCVQAASGSFVNVESFEPTEDGAGVNRDLFISEGDGAGQARTVSAYSGSDREITLATGWSVLPTTRSRYTSRPDLPADLRDAFVYGSAARLVEKYQDERFVEFTRQRMEKLNAAYTALNTMDRRGPLETYDVDSFGHGDPDWDWGF